MTSDLHLVVENDLPELRARLRGASRVAVDTEFHAERRYLPKLFLVQLHLDELLGELQHATLGDSGALEVGAFVMAMGSPLALARSLTLGVVSNVERVMGVVRSMRCALGKEFEVETALREALMR